MQDEHQRPKENASNAVLETRFLTIEAALDYGLVHKLIRFVDELE